MAGLAVSGQKPHVCEVFRLGEAKGQRILTFVRNMPMTKASSYKQLGRVAWSTGRCLRIQQDSATGAMGGSSCEMYSHSYGVSFMSPLNLGDAFCLIFAQY